MFNLVTGSVSNKEDSGSEIKSPISLVHEVALRRNLTVKFEVVKVTGPPHMRSFHTLCTVGEFTTEGIGNGKKVIISGLFDDQPYCKLHCVYLSIQVSL